MSSWEVFREVAVATLDFEIYLIETHGWTDDELATSIGLRALDQSMTGGFDGASQAHHTAKERRNIKPEESRKIIKSLNPDLQPWIPEPSQSTDPFLERRPALSARIATELHTCTGTGTPSDTAAVAATRRSLYCQSHSASTLLQSRRATA